MQKSHMLLPTSQSVVKQLSHCGNPHEPSGHAHLMTELHCAHVAGSVCVPEGICNHMGSSRGSCGTAFDHEATSPSASSHAPQHWQSLTSTPAALISIPNHGAPCRCRPTGTALPPFRSLSCNRGRCILLAVSRAGPPRQYHFQDQFQLHSLLHVSIQMCKHLKSNT